MRTSATWPPAAAPIVLNCAVVDVTADFTNTATVTATDPLGGPDLTASDAALVDVVSPGVSITKTASQAQVVTGNDVTFTIEVTNTGDRPLAGLDRLRPAGAAIAMPSSRRPAHRSRSAPPPPSRAR